MRAQPVARQRRPPGSRAGASGRSWSATPAGSPTWRAAAAASVRSDRSPRLTVGHADRASRDLSAAGPTLAMPGKEHEQEGRAEMRFLHTADWQLGMTRHFLERRGAATLFGRPPRRGRRPRRAGRRVGAEFVVVAGDVFEHNQLAPRDVSQSLEAMRAIGVPVYLLPGNHDPLDASSVYTSALFTAERPDNVTVLDRAGVHEVRPGLQIVAAPWRSKAPTTDLVADVLDGLAGRRRHSHRRRARRRRHPRPRQGQAVADPARRTGGRDRTWRGALCRVGGQALPHPGRRRPAGSGTPAHPRSPTTTTSSPTPATCCVVDIDEDDPLRPVRVDARRVGRWRFVTLLPHRWTAAATSPTSTSTST